MQITVFNPDLTLTQLLNEFDGYWNHFEDDYPTIETLIDYLSSLHDIRHYLVFGDIEEAEFRHRIRFAVAMLMETLGEAMAFLVIGQHPFASMISAIRTLEAATVSDALNVRFALPCLVNLLSYVSVDLQPSDVDVGFVKAMDLLEISDEEQQVLSRSYTVIAPTIH